MGDIYINVVGLHIHTTIAILAAIAAGVVLVLIIIIWLCCCLCCRRKNRNKKKITNTIAAEDPPIVAKGNQHGDPAQQRQQQNYPPRIAEHHMNPNPSPRPAPAAPPLHQNPNPSPRPAASPLQQKPNPSSRPAAPPLHQKPNRSPPQPLSHVSTSSSGSSNSLPPPQPSRRSPAPQVPSSYPSSGMSTLSGDESSFPPPSPALSYGSSQIMFTYNELAMATKGFSEATILGQGGFGFVHKGVLPNGKEIAVKSLKANSGQGEREFETEVEIISRVHHRHLVSLVGYCIHGSQRLLVYEFVPNKTLEFHLHSKGQSMMDWPTRLKVAVGSAKGLAYLHEDCQPRIIHRDIKAANILLDNSFQPKVADFGLAKFTPEADTHVSTRIMGTLGYLAPEYASSGRLSDKSDVYSFGVMLLELITGKKPVDKAQKDYTLVDWARPLLTTAIEDENFNYLVDPRLQFSYKHSEMARMVACAATCVRKSARHRPLMSQVVRALEGNMTLSDLNEGITPGRSLVHRYNTASEHSGSQYKNSRGFESSNMAPSTGEYAITEYDGTTSEYGLYASISSSEGQTTVELNTDEVQRERRRFLQQRV